MSVVQLLQNTLSEQLAIVDIDVQRLVQERLKNTSFSSVHSAQSFRKLSFRWPDNSPPQLQGRLRRPDLSQLPFVPDDPTQRAQHCEEIVRIQSTGLAND